MSLPPWIGETVSRRSCGHPRRVVLADILPTKARRTRIERLCCTEERRFATRANREDRRWSDVLVPPFDKGAWRVFWDASLFQRAKMAVAAARKNQ